MDKKTDISREEMMFCGSHIWNQSPVPLAPKAMLLLLCPSASFLQHVGVTRVLHLLTGSKYYTPDGLPNFPGSPRVWAHSCFVEVKKVLGVNPLPSVDVLWAANFRHSLGWCLRYSLRNQTFWGSILVLSLPNCVILGELFDMAMPHLHHL